MDESEDNMSPEDILMMESPSLNKIKPKKRSLVERELETNMTARVTSPVTHCDTACTSRYGRARRIKTDADYIDTEKGIKIMTSPVYVKTPVKIQSPVYKMHASNSPIKTEPNETPQKVEATDSNLDNQIENIYHENISLSRFGSDEKKTKSPGNQFPKVYVRKDLIQSREKEEYVMMIKNMFSPVKSSEKSNSHLNNILERSSEKYCLNSSTENSKSHNGLLSNSSVVKTLDFDNKKKKKENRDGKVVPSKSELFDLEAKCEYQVGDLAWARMGTFPFWPCIVTREPASGMFVKKKLFGRIERDVIHVTFFGDNGRRGWIVDTMLRRFLGQQEFETTREAFSPSAKKKDPRLYAAFFVSEKKMPQWNISVEEAETLLREPKRLRIDILYDMLAKARSSKCTPKQQKSGKITRTISDVASDVSLSESLYDTLFSEDDGKSEDTERSRSKTRMSLDVSEVVTACLDNMAAKTGITKIQRQSHMDRWLQKAKSKTPEKLQANLTPQQKEKEMKVASGKKKKKISPIRVPIQKPYSFRKSSYEPQILKSHDNEHDYSTKISNDLPQTSDENNVTADFAVSLTVKAELLHDKAESIDCKTKSDQTSEALKETCNDIASRENAKNTIEIGHIDIAEEQIDEIQVNMCSVEENDELLLGHAGIPIDISQIVDEPTKDTGKPIKIKLIAYKTSPDTEKQSAIVKMPNIDSTDADKQVIPHKHKADVSESSENANKTDKYRLRNKKTIEVTKQIAGKSIETEKHCMDTKNPTRNTRVPAIESKILSESRKDSPEFVKYLELRQDSLIDEHPELSQAEIEDYLYKTWQYEESSKSELRKNEDCKLSGLVKGLKIKNKKCLSLNSNSKKKSTKKQDKDKLAMNTFLSGTCFTRLSNSSAIAMDKDERMSSVTKESSRVKSIESVQIVTEHSYTEKHPETTQDLDEHKEDPPILSIDNIKIETSLIEDATPVRRSLRTKVSKSPAIAMDTNEIIISVGKESSSVRTVESTLTMTEHTEKHHKTEQNFDEHKVDTQTLPIDNIKKETSLIEDATPVRRSLRAKVSKSSAIAMDTNEIINNVSKESSLVRTVENTLTKTEHTEKLHKTEQNLDEHKVDTPKLSIDIIKIETSLIEDVTPVRRSLRAKVSKSPAIAMDTNEMINSLSKESTSVRTVDSTLTMTEHCNTEEHPESKENMVGMDTPKLNIDKEKIETSLIEGCTPVRRSLRTKLPKSPAIALQTNEIMSSVSEETCAVKAIESTQIVTENCDIEMTPKDELEIDSPNLFNHIVKKEIIETSLTESSTPVRRSLREKSSNSPAIAIDTNEITTGVNQENITSQTIETTLIVTEHCNTETTQKLEENKIDTPKLSNHNVNKEMVQTSLIESSTPVRRSLRAKLSKSPAIAIDMKEITSGVNKENSTLKTIQTTIVAEHCNAEKLPDTTYLSVETPKQSEYNMDKEKQETTQIAGATSSRRSFRTKLSNSAAITLDTNSIVNSVSKETSTDKTIGSTQVLTENSSTEIKSETTQKSDKHEKDEPKQSECNIDKEEKETILIVGDTSVRRSLRTKYSKSLVFPLDTNEMTNRVSTERSIIKTKGSSNIVTENSSIEKHFETSKKPDKHEIDPPKLSEYNIKKEKIETTLTVGDTAVRRSLRTRLSNSLAVSMDTNETLSSASKENNTEKSIESVQIEKHCFSEIHSEMLQKPDVDRTDTPIQNEYDIKKEKVVEKHDTSTENFSEFTKVANELRIDMGKQVDTIQIVDERINNDTENQEGTALVNDERCINTKKQVDIVKLTKEPRNYTEKQAQMMLVVNKHPVKNDQTILDEDKEYGHLDFVFSCLNEKLLAKNDINKSVIENNKYMSKNEIGSKDVEMAKSKRVINSEKTAAYDLNYNNNKPNSSNSNTSPKNLIDEDVNNFPSLEETKIFNLDQCKYKKLYDSCTNLRVRVERLPSLSHKVINIKDLENEILISNSRQNEAINKIDTNNTDSKAEREILFEDVIENSNNTATCIAHATDNEIGKTIDKENEVKSKTNVDDESIKDNVNNKGLENTEPNIYKENLTNAVDSNSYCSVDEKVVSSKISDNRMSSDIPESKQTVKNIVADMNKHAKADLLLDENDIENNHDSVNIPPVVLVKSETVHCPEIKPSPLANGYEYIFDDDEDEFESPAFSPIFKEPIDSIPGEKENDENNDMVTASDKNDTNIKNNSVLKEASNELPPGEELDISTKNKNREVVKNNHMNELKKEKHDKCVKDELIKSVSRLPEPVKINGFHLDEYGIDFSDNDFNVETSSLNSDSEPLAVTKNKLLSKKRKDAKKALQDKEFVKYLELRQDALMEEHPELNQDEIVDYLYKTWHYEENTKSDIVKNDDIEQAGLVKGLNDNLRQKSIRNSYRENKKRTKKRDDDTISVSSNISKKRSKIQDEDTLSINSDISDTSIRQRLRTRFSNSPVISMDENEIRVSKESSPERKPHIEDIMSVDSDECIKITKRKVRNQILDDSLDGDESFFITKEKPNSKDESTVKLTIKTEETRPKRIVEKKLKSPKSNNDSNIKKYFSAIETKTNHTDEQETIDVNKKIKEENDPETVSITSINSEDSEVSLSKRKQRKNEKQTTKTMDDPEFLKYVELRQDVLIDENPQLTQEEIVSYLYKTWLYEESAKSDLKKSDDIEQANLVKGLSTEVQPKKVKKKIKVEKFPVDEEIALKDKPRRKISPPFYCEDIMSDIEDEIELFEIFKTAKKSNVIKSEGGNEDVNKTNNIKSSDVKTEVEQIVIQDEIDEVELYFSQLPLPKPNVFKGLVREKVCEICEKTGNLVKCKGCSGMFHVDCEMKVQAGVVAATRGRKKKKKPGRKPKNFEDSESHSDEKSQDVSEENNVSIEEIETEPRVVDEAVFEAALSAKMKELLPTIDLTYDSYSSDDGLDWNSAPPGHCEIVDVKLKPKIVIDYSDFKCKNCQTFSTPVCFVCKEAVSKTGVDHRQKCQTNHCNKYYHLECLDHWPQTQFNSGEPSKSNKKVNEHFEAVMCPRHVCHTCVSDDPRGCKTRFSGDKLARCVKCPATYHSFTKCLPAGTQILTGSLIVCPRHYEQRSGKVPCHVNTGWCFICALGGSLICCEYCPTSFHAECLNIKPPEGGYMCEDCETGRLPLYGEMVWVKLGHYRWWPGIILHPSEIPENIMAVKHSPGEFVVRFFGQYDHYWVNRGRVFPFQEGDSGRISTQKSKIDAAFITAMEHAHRAFEILKNAQPNDEEAQDIASSLLPPHYVKLKVNKPCGSLIGRRPDVEESSLTQCECDPKVDDPCGPYSHCLNRMLLTECGPICRAGDRCSNRAFEKRLYPRLAPYRTPQRGWGLKTLQDIRAGQFVIEYVGELLDEEEFKRRMNRMHEIRDENFYFLTLDKERMIDAGPKGNLARFMNHCCEPNCETQKWTVLGDVRVGLFAIYDIPANSELTFNYNLECTGIEKKRCMCGARRCSGYIGAKPKQDETLPKKKRTYKKRAKPIEESPSTSKNKPKRPVGRPAKPRELTEIEKDLLIIKNATNSISSDSETSSRLSSIDNPNPKALKRKRVSFSTEESVCSSPSTKKGSEDSSPSTKKAKIEEISPSTKTSKSDDTITNTPSAKKLKIEEKSEVGD